MDNKREKKIIDKIDDDNEKPKTVMLNNLNDIKDELFKLIIHLNIHKSNKYILITNAIKSFNDVIDVALSEIITKNFPIEDQIPNENTNGSDNIKYIKFEVKFSNVRVTRPTSIIPDYSRRSDNDKKEKPLYPTAALNDRKNYQGNVLVDVDIIATGITGNKNTGAISSSGSQNLVRKESIKNFILTTIPIMVGSKYCNTYGLSRDNLKLLGENYSLTRGGHFVFNGADYAIPIKESGSRFNIPRVYESNNDDEVIKLMMLGKYGSTYENSRTNEFILHKDDKISVVIITSSDIKTVRFPLYMIFRLLGCTDDSEIFSYILEKDIGTPNNQVVLEPNEEKMKNIIYKHFISNGYGTKKHMFPKNAINVRLPVQCAELCVRYIQESKIAFKDQDFKKNPEFLQNAMRIMFNIIDNEFLPYIGKTAAARSAKKKELGHLIRKLLRCHPNLKLDEITDRDSSIIKSYQSVGDLFALSLKTILNKTVFMKIKEKFRDAFQNSSFENVKLASTFENSIRADKIGKHITSSIVRNDGIIKISKKDTIQKRMSSIRDDCQSPLKSTSLRRTLENPLTGANQAGSDRSLEMRRPHPSSEGYICPIHSPVGGEKIGITKNLALTADITIRNTKQATILEDIIRKHPKLKRYDDYSSPTDVYNARGLVIIRLNGVPMAYTDNVVEIIKDFTEMRRSLKIGKTTSIEWPINNPRELLLSTDQGRLYRPVVIVYNNVRDYEMFGLKKPASYKDFKQSHGFTMDVVNGIMRGKIGYKDLFAMKIIEYMTPQEQARMLFASDYGVLMKNQNNPLLQYTHLEIPISLFAITTLTSPLANYSSFTKWVYQISQQKQSGDIPVYNYAHRNDAKTFVMFGKETGLVKTFIENYVRIGYKNFVVAISEAEGFNQDDSSTINRAVGDCLKINGHLLDNDQEEIDTGETIGIPDPSITKDIKASNYAKLGPDGCIMKGQLVTKGDIIIGKYKSIHQEEKIKNSNFKYIDLSREYSLDIPALVYDVVRGKNDDRKEFIKVCYMMMIPAGEGSKLSSRHGQKGIVSRNLNSRDMLFTADGLMPHIIINPHSFPKRMTMGQFYEALLSILAVSLGTSYVADPFTIIDNEYVKNEMKKLGLDYSGTQTVYNGKTGRPVDAKIYIAPTGFKLAQGFSESIMYASEVPAYDQIYGQPVGGGKQSSGGLKISELNQNVLFAHGSGRVFAQKFFEDSDGVDDYCIYVCKCGRHAIFNPEYPKYKCLVCKSNAQIYQINSCKAALVFMKELNALHINPRLDISDS